MVLIALLVGCHWDTQATSAETLASAEFQAAVDAAVVKSMEGREGEPQLENDVEALTKMAKCLSTVKRDAKRNLSTKAMRKCGHIGLDVQR